MHRYIPVFLLTLLFSGGFVLWNALAVQSTDSSRYFPETHHTVGGTFLTYWEQQGGLPQQGYPLTDELHEVSDVNSQTYTVQYFERAIFESHPENQAPYNVLLSLLGVFEYQHRYGATGAPNQHVSSANPRFFPETKHTIGGRFRTYWEQHGGLAQQGYPISDEFQEISVLNGQPYTVQYFQRAVFELHPENTPPYDVLLAQLGRFRYDVRYSGIAVSPSPSPPHAAHLLATTVIGIPVAAQRSLFWLDARSTQLAIYGYDIDDQQTYLVTDQPGNKSELSTDGQRVTWVTSSSSGKQTVHAYDPTTHSASIVVDAIGVGELGGIALTRTILYYQDSAAIHHGIYARNLATGQERLVSAIGQNPVAAGDILLWSAEQRDGAYQLSEWSLHLQTGDPSTGDQIIARGAGQFSRYHVAGNYIAWSFLLPAADTRVYLYNTADRRNRSVSVGRASYPVLGEGQLAWSNEPREGMPGWSISVMMTGAGAIQDVVTGSSTLLQPAAVWGEGQVAYTVQDAAGASTQSLYFAEP